MRSNIIICLILFVSTYTYSQSFDTNQNNIDFSNVRFGFKLTPSISWLNVDHNNVIAEGADMKMGLGVVAEYPISNSFLFVSGVNLRGFGGYVQDSLSRLFIDTLTTYKINYKEIEVPFGLKLETKTIRKVSYFIQGGVTVGFILDANEKYFPSNSNLKASYVDIIYHTIPTRLSYQVGVGVNYNFLGKSKLFGTIFYNKSISNIADSDTYTTGTSARYAEPIEILPGSMEFSIGILF